MTGARRYQRHALLGADCTVLYSTFPHQVLLVCVYWGNPIQLRASPVPTIQAHLSAKRRISSAPCSCRPRCRPCALCPHFVPQYIPKRMKGIRLVNQSSVLGSINLAVHISSPTLLAHKKNFPSRTIAPQDTRPNNSVPVSPAFSAAPPLSPSQTHNSPSQSTVTFFDL